jgi:hypothetical protein
MVHKKLNYGRKSIFKAVLLEKFQVKDSFTLKLLNTIFFSWKNNSLVIIYRFGSHKYFKNSVKCFLSINNLYNVFLRDKKQKGYTYENFYLVNLTLWASQLAYNQEPG